MLADPSLIKEAQKINLRYITDNSPGLSRVKSGKGFKYVDQNGVTIYNQNTLERIQSLRIPPAWEDVWISTKDNTHLQATGIDSKGRKQYIYHPDWIRITQENKFDKLSGFAESLPGIRKKVAADLHSTSLSKNQILATIVWLLEHTFIRIGNDEYAKDNNHFGLTTLRGKHVSVWGENIRFEFRGKSGIDHLISISHPTVAKTIKKCIELPGYEIFKCVDSEGKRHIVDSSDVNGFLKEISGEEITAKDFRTWGATVLAATHLSQLDECIDEKISASNIAQTAKVVSKQLGNTPTICRKYYIHPTVINTYSKKILTAHFQKHVSKKPDFLTQDEYKTLTLLQKY